MPDPSTLVQPGDVSDVLSWQLPDHDPDETREWEESLEALVSRVGKDRARYVLLRLLERGRQLDVGIPAIRSTDYVKHHPPGAGARLPR